eukprot:Colp12_sorted_trinity150504_noHs@7575
MTVEQELTQTAFIDRELDEKILDIAHYISEKKKNAAFAKAVEPLVEQEKFSEAIELLVNNCESVFAPGEKDYEGVFNLLTSLLQDVEDAQLSYKLAVKMANVMLTGSQEVAAARFKIMANLFNNLRANDPARYVVYYNLGQLAVATNKIELLVPQFSEIPRWLEEWKTDLNQTRALYKLLANASKNYSSKISHSLLVRYLETFTEADAAEAKDDAIRCIVEAAAIPDMYEYDELSRLAPVAALKKEGHLAYKMLDLFVNGSLSDYTTFAEANKDAVAKLGFSHEADLVKFRLLTLVTVGTNNKSIPYADVAAALKISEDEVEESVIEAIAAGLLEARLDSVNQRVNVSRVTQRTFGKEQWQELHNKFSTWQQNLTGILETIEAARQQALRKQERAGH